MDESFLRFARENGAADLVERVLGASVWDFMSGPEALHIYGTLFDRAYRARSSGAPKCVPFRCDTPGVILEMDLTIERMEDRALRLTARLLREEPRGEVSLLDAEAPRSRDVIRMCSWCKRTSVDRSWHEVEHALPRLMRSASGHLPRLTHAACPAGERSPLVS